MRTKKYIKGFTLIELMIVVAIVGIIAAIAYPSYMESVRKSNRTDATVELNDIAQQLQRCFTAYSAYNHDDCGIYDKQLKGGKKIVTDQGLYGVTASNIEKTKFTLRAEAETGKMQASDSKCTAFTLTHTGVKEAEGSDKDNCW